MKIKLKGTDAIKVNKSGELVQGYNIEDVADEATKKKAHRDAIQLIPKRFDGTHNTQFAGAIIEDVTVKDNTIFSDGKLQGIFASDGGIRNTIIEDNVIDTNGRHFVSLCMIDGTIKNNRNEAGELIPIKLFPMRIGGNPDGKFNVFILTFKDDLIKYLPAKDIVKDDNLDHVMDCRFDENRRKDGIYLYDFDYEAFVTEAGKKQLTATEMRSLALQYGTTKNPLIMDSPIIKENNMKMSTGGLQVLRASENVSYDVYLDQAGLPTIGVGHCLTRSEVMSGKIELNDGSILDIRNGGITSHQVNALLESDLQSRESAINKLVDVPLEQYQFDSLVHFIFNVGETAFKKSTLLRKLNQGFYTDVPEQISRWKYITKNGKKIESNGLINRRKVEVDLWNGEYQKERGATEIIQPDYSPMPEHKPVSDELFKELLLQFESRFMDKIEQTEVEILNSNEELKTIGSEINIKEGSAIYDQVYTKAKEKIFTNNTKPDYQSKIIIMVVGTITAYFGNKYGWDVSAETKDIIANIIIVAGSIGIIVARKWFTNKFLKKNLF